MKAPITPEMLTRLSTEERTNRAQAIVDERICMRVQAMQDAEQRKAKAGEVVDELRQKLAAAKAYLERTEDELQAAREEILSYDLNAIQRRNRAKRATKAAQSAQAKALEAENQAIATAFALSTKQSSETSLI